MHCNSHRVLTSLQASSTDFVKVSNAIISVFDKEGIVQLAKFLVNHGVKIFSTGGTFIKLKDSGIPKESLEEISEYTGSNEILDGRVKTLHPKIYGGILYVRGNSKHENQIIQEDIKPIDLVIVNLYPFEKAIKQNPEFNTAIENIDIGGPCMIRAAAKNNSYVTVVSSPNNYQELQNIMDENKGYTSQIFRRKMAGIAFKQVSQYDDSIQKYMHSTLNESHEVDIMKEEVNKTYYPQIKLKYGCNPHQSPAAIYSLFQDGRLPFKSLNGTPGYINFLDALLSFQLVNELKEASGLAAAASFKHCSPAGAALGRSLTDFEKEVYEINKADNYSSVASAYILARNSDAMCSFGDFAGVSDEVDVTLANYLKREVCDGIIAPSYTDEAFEILKQKKNGNFIIIQGDPTFKPPQVEYREVYGVTLMQKRNNLKFTPDLFTNIKSKNQSMSKQALNDIILATISVKYTQSNSVCFSHNSQLTGVGAGQQSRVDCTKLAGRKSAMWYLRQHPKVHTIKFKSHVKKQDRINMRIRYIEGDFVEFEYQSFCEKCEEVPEPLTVEEKSSFLKQLDNVALSSDAFFPFRDSIDHAYKYGVKFVAHPGGSLQDTAVTEAADQYNMVMVHTNTRAFLH